MYMCTKNKLSRSRLS